MMGIKIAAIVFAFSGVGFGIWDYIRTKQNNSVLEATLSSTTEAFADYATNVEAEVAAWYQTAMLLSDEYNNAREERDDVKKRLSNVDWEEIAERHPEMLINRINAGTQRMFNELEAATNRTRHASSSPATETRVNVAGSGNLGDN